MIELVELCTVEFVLGDRFDAGKTPTGRRYIGEVASAKVRGERLSGVAEGASGADWVTFARGVGIVDVRFAIRTDDGALILVRYGGRVIPPVAESVQTIVAPTFETGDERYAWLNHVQALGRGGMSADGEHVEYTFYEAR